MKELFQAYRHTSSHLYDLMILAWRFREKERAIPEELKKRIKKVSDQTDQLRDLCLTSQIRMIPKK